MKDYSSHINSWVEWAFEAELLIGSKDTFEQVESTYSSTGAASSGTITFTDNPSYNDSITLNGVTLFFRNIPTSTTSLGQHGPANAINIKTTLALTLAEMVSELNGVSSSNSNNAAGFIFSDSLEGYTYTEDGTTLTITKKEVGLEGNNYTLESSKVNAICSGSHLTGGKGLLSNQQLRLPDNIVKLLGVRGGTGDSNYRHAELLQSMSVHRERAGRDALDTQQKALKYYIRGNRLNVQHDSITEITIAYSAYPTDAKGHPMIKDSHTTAVAQYIMWQQKNIDFINGKLSMYVVKELEKRWYFLCGKARGDDNMPTAEELKQIGKIWNTMVPVKNNRGLLDL